MRSLATASLALLLAACGGGDTEPGIDMPRSGGERR